MNAPSPDVFTAFTAWRNARIAAYYAEPCPDELMDKLVDRALDAERALAATPARCADDILLKVLCLALAAHEQTYAGAPIMLPRVDRDPGTDYTEDAMWEAVIADLLAISPLIAEATTAPPLAHQVEGQVA